MSQPQIIIRWASMNKKSLFLIIFLSLVPMIFLPGCGKKGKLLKFSNQYQLYPQHWQKYLVFVKEGEPEYVVYDSDKYKERWVYICQNKVYNFQALPRDGKKDDDEERFKITSESLKNSNLEKKLSAKDKGRINNCIEKKS